MRTLVKGLLVFSWLSFCPQAVSQELSPWYSRDFEIKPTATYTYRNSSSIASKSHAFYKPLYGHFYKFAVQVPIFNWSGGCGLLFANGRDRAFGIDNSFLSGCYRFMDDTAGFDPISLVVGGTLVFASKAALQDRSSFHHGRLEALFHVSAGKEWSDEQFWLHRLWASALLGLSDVGSPWWQVQLAWEQNREGIDRFSLYLSGLYGCGGATLKPHASHFHGYGPIAHRSVDVGARYTCYFDAGAEASFEYRHAIYAFNFPRNTNCYSCRFSYPFGL